MAETFFDDFCPYICIEYLKFSEILYLIQLKYYLIPHESRMSRSVSGYLPGIKPHF